MVYYSMNNLRGRTGSTRHLMRGLGCNADSSTTFGGGETRHENARASKIGGSMKLRHPASNLFYEKTTTTNNDNIISVC
jgi:hypothetical protein